MATFTWSRLQRRWNVFMFKENPVLATFLQKNNSHCVSLRWWQFLCCCFFAFPCFRCMKVLGSRWWRGAWKSPWSHPNSNERICCAHVLPFHSEQETSISDCDRSPVYLASMSCSAQCLEHSGPTTTTILWWSQLPFPLMQLSLTKSNTSVSIASILPFSLRFQWLSAVGLIFTVMNPRCVWHLATIFYCRLTAVWCIFFVPLAKY